MINFLSDNHGPDFMDGLLNYQPENKDDLLILLGDTCLKISEEEKYQNFDRWLLSREYNIAIVDGNHENYSWLDSQPEETWNGGKINRISKNILRLRRGEIYNIEGDSFFVFGGCSTSKKWKELGLWHEGDTPSKAQLENAYENLKKANYQVDYILTHKYFCNECFVPMGGDEHSLFMLNRFIDNNVSFKKWISGHRHQDYFIDEKHQVVFTTVRSL